MSLVETNSERLPLWKRFFGGGAVAHVRAAARHRPEETRSVVSAERSVITTRENFASGDGADQNPTQGAVDAGRILSALGSFEDTKLLLAQGASVHATDQHGRTLLHQAVLYENREVAELLLDLGANVNARNAFGFAPLHTAARFGMKEVAELLLTRGANVNILDNYGGTPLQCAVERGHEEIVELLRRNGAEETVPLNRATDMEPGRTGAREILDSPTPAESTREGRGPQRPPLLPEHTAVGSLSEQPA